MDKQEPKYGLRTRKSDFKGKYREMLGVNVPLTNGEKKEPTMDLQSVDDGNKECNILVLPHDESKECKIFVLPLVMSEGEILTEDGNAIEVEISGEGALAELTEEGTSLTLDFASKKESDPLDHIEEILKQNNELIHSIPEAHYFKPRKNKINDDQPGYSSSQDMSYEEQEDSVMSASRMNEPFILSLAIVQDMLLRPLIEEERELIESLLKEGKQDELLQTFFGPETEGRVRKCSVCCDLVEGSDSVYATHYNEDHNCKPIFTCELCGQTSERSSIYFCHLKSHFNAQDEVEGNAKSKSDDNRKESASGEPYVCDICGKTLKHQKSLYSHRRTHTDAKAVCHICGATLKSSRYLHHHLLLHKDVDKPHKCDKCEKAFFSSSALKVHHYYNHEENPGRFQCTICGKKFKAKQGLQFHMDSHSTELRYECSYCHKKFRGFKTCRVHELRHREANEPNKFSCNICGKHFKTRQTLKNHEDVHASFNRYQCSLCEKRFKLRKSCLAHIRVHHNDQESRNASTAVTDEGEMAVESLLAAGEEYVVTLEDDGEVENVLLQNSDEQAVELVVPEAHVECEVPNGT